MARLRPVKSHVHPIGTPGAWEFICLGCQSIHCLPPFAKIRGGDTLPTVRPDITFTVGPFRPGHPNAGKTVQCHFRITDGAIRYFHDSTHGMEGKTVPLPDFEELAAMRAQVAQGMKAPTEDEEAAAPAGIPD